jgi:glycosyltransferase involved in cell wall biosynthesis
MNGILLGVNSISIFTAVMNRQERLSETIENWLQFDWFDEIVIVDWSSEIPFTFRQHPKVKIYRVDGEPSWILSQSFNLAASLTSGDIIVKMDADYRIDQKFGNIFPMPKNTYYHGNWCGPWSISKVLEEWNAEKENRILWEYDVDVNPQYLNGFVACHKKDFESVNGYNERITSYGWDDSDLYQRLNEVATPLHITTESGIWHEPHHDKERVSNQVDVDIKTNWEFNKTISEENPWSINDKRQQWKFINGVYTK